MKLEIKNLTGGYGNKMIIRDFSTAVETGDILCLLGPNGVGKTTLFKSILGFLKMQGGEISLDGKNMEKFSWAEQARIIGYVPQSSNPPFPFSVIDVVVMGRTAHLGMFGTPGKKDFQKAYEVLEQLQIVHLAENAFTELSGGERQMVMIARALVQQPAFIMLDEPTASLDFGNQAKVLQRILSLSKNGIGIIMTTHYPDHAFLCDGKVVLLQRGDTYHTGHAGEVLTEENLTKAYGVKVRIIQSEMDGITMRFCAPDMSITQV